MTGVMRSARICGLALALLMLGAAAPSWKAGANAAQGADLLLGVPYRLDPPPNYEAAMAPAGTELTDGNVGQGRIWTSGAAAGWSWRMPVTATFDLARPAAVDHVRVHTASGTSAGVHKPSQILVFGGDGAGGFGFLGASALGSDLDDSATAATAAIDIRFPPTRVKQLVVVVFARGAFVFMSEVEAFGGAGAGRALSEILPDMAAVLKSATERRAEAIAALPGPRPAGPDLAHRWAMPLAAGTGGVEAAAGCTAERIDPWSGATAAPDEGGGAAAFDAPLAALAGGRDYAAWRIVNRSQADMPVRVGAAATGAVATRVFALAHAQALNRAWVPDVVEPFGGATLPARSAMLVLVEAAPAAAGRFELRTSIACGGDDMRETLPLTAVAADPAVPPLHGNLWTYLHQPDHVPVAQALACDPGFLARYGVDTVVVHPDALRGDDAQAAALLSRYFDAYRGAARVLLWMDIKMRHWDFVGMPDEEAAQWLRGWWARVTAAAREAGVQGELLLYPIDEPKPSDLPAMRHFRQLAREAGIDAPVYATLEKRSLLLLPWVDRAQLLHPSALDLRLAAVLAGHGGFESYDTREDARLLSPDGYYRRQGWDAYALGLAGVGVWSAWDGTGLASPRTGWDPFTGNRERDFGIIYAAPDGCAWPSLRLLAWRRGMEENRLFRQCAGRLPAGRVDGVVQAAMDDGLATAQQAVVSTAQECAG